MGRHTDFITRSKGTQGAVWSLKGVHTLFLKGTYHMYGKHIFV